MCVFVFVSLCDVLSLSMMLLFRVFLVFHGGKNSKNSLIIDDGLD